MNQLPNQSIIITGYSGAGKTTLVNYLAKDGWNIVSAGKIMTDIVKSFHQKPSREFIQKFSVGYFEKYGYKDFLEHLIEASKNKEKVIYEGIRPIEIIRDLVSILSNTKIIFIDAPEKVRKERLIARDKLNTERVERIQRHSIEKQLSEVKQIANIVLMNDKDVINLVKECKKAIASFNF